MYLPTIGFSVAAITETLNISIENQTLRIFLLGVLAAAAVYLLLIATSGVPSIVDTAVTGEAVEAVTVDIDADTIGPDAE